MKFFKMVYIYLLFPIYTLWFANHASLKLENLSYVGNLKGMHVHFMMWAIACVVALSFGCIGCARKCIHYKYIRPFIVVSACLFMGSIVLPYLPSNYPVLAQLHISMSFIGLILFLMTVGLIVLDLKMLGSIFPYDSLLVVIYGIALGIYGSNFMSVNSQVEVFLAIVMPIYLHLLWMKITKKKV